MNGDTLQGDTDINVLPILCLRLRLDVCNSINRLLGLPRTYLTYSLKVIRCM